MDLVLAATVLLFCGIVMPFSRVIRKLKESRRSFLPRPVTGFNNWKRIQLSKVERTILVFGAKIITNSQNYG